MVCLKIYDLYSRLKNMFVNLNNQISAFAVSPLASHGLHAHLFCVLPHGLSRKREAVHSLYTYFLRIMLPRILTCILIYSVNRQGLGSPCNFSHGLIEYNRRRKARLGAPHPPPPDNCKIMRFQCWEESAVLTFGKGVFREHSMCQLNR